MRLCVSDKRAMKEGDIYTQSVSNGKPISERLIFSLYSLTDENSCVFQLVQKGNDKRFC